MNAAPGLRSLVLALLLPTLAGCIFAGSRHEGPPNARFDGRRFQNAVPSPTSKGLSDVIWWQLTSDAAVWPEWIESEAGPPPPRRARPDELRVTFVNHATVLVQVDGLNILTDPIWSERASPLEWAGPRRVRAPGLRFEDLPPIDVVLISHNHYDHLDMPTLVRLHEAHHPTFFVGLGNRGLLEDADIDGVIEVEWWRGFRCAGRDLEIWSVPVQHFSGRSLSDRDATLWTGYVVTSSRGPIFFAGDTGFGPHFAEIAERFGPLRLAILPIGAYEPRWFMRHVHMNPAEAVEAHQVLRAQDSVGVHFGTFQLTDEAIDTPARELATALEEAGVDPATFHVLEFGEGRVMPSPSPTTTAHSPAAPASAR